MLHFIIYPRPDMSQETLQIFNKLPESLASVPSRDHAEGQNHNPEVPPSTRRFRISNFLTALMSWGSWFSMDFCCASSMRNISLLLPPSNQDAAARPGLTSWTRLENLQSSYTHHLLTATQMININMQTVWKSPGVSRGDPSVCWNYHNLTAKRLSSPDALTLPKGTLRGSSPAISAGQSWFHRAAI